MLSRAQMLGQPLAFEGMCYKLFVTVRYKLFTTVRSETKVSFYFFTFTLFTFCMYYRYSSRIQFSLQSLHF